MKINIDRTLTPLVDFCICLLIIFRNYSMLSRDSAYGISEDLMDVALIALCAAGIMFQFLAGHTVVKKSGAVGLLLTIGISTLSVVVPGVNVAAGLLRFAGMLSLATFYFLVHPRPYSFVNRYVNIVTVMAAVSLVLYIFGTVLDIIPPSRIAAYEYAGAPRYCNTYFGLQYEAQTAREIPFLGYRNCGFFIEAPMYNIVLCFALAAELSFRSKVRIPVIILLAVTILSTMTTTGLLFLLIAAAVYMLNAGKSNNAKAIKIMALPLVILVGLFIVTSILENKQATASGAVSMSIRTDHTIAFIKMWADRPFFGFGYANSEAFYSYTNYRQGYSIGLPALLGRCGGLVFLLYFVPWLTALRKGFVSNHRHLYFYLGTFACLLMTAVVYHPIMLFTIAFQITDRRESPEVCPEDSKNDTNPVTLIA